MIKKDLRNPWLWVPSLYFAEGLPYVVVMTVSVIMYKRLGISNTEIALYTSWLYLPWVIKPLWSPVVDLLKTKRIWIIISQLFIGAGLAGVAFTIPTAKFFQYTLAFFWLMAFSSATHDIAADGFYMLGLSKHQQAFFVGVRSTFYRIAMITGQGLLIILAGYIESSTGLPPVDITVFVKNDQSTILTIDSVGSAEQELDNQLQLIIEPKKLFINTSPLPKEKFDSMLIQIKHSNITNEFYSSNKNGNNSSSVNEVGQSWWDEYIVRNLENFLKDNFGPKKKIAVPDSAVGNIGVLNFTLSLSPIDDEEIIVNFSFESGDKSISLIEGTRFTFNKNNWNIPAFALIQIDKKLDEETTAVFQARSGNSSLAWMITFFILTALFVALVTYHKFILPKTTRDHSIGEMKNIIKDFFNTFAMFFQKEKIILILVFILLYRLGEAQLVKLTSPFMLDTVETGGLGLTLGEVGFIYGTIGVIGLVVGGLLGGFVVSRNGLKCWIWWMLIAINLPNAVYIYLAYAMPDSLFIISLYVVIEQFGYGFGFTALMLYTIYVYEGDYKTAHFAITTGFMALGMMLPGMISGWLQEIIGYQHFFIWVLIVTIPIFIITKFIPLDSGFGKKKETTNK